ncbi:MAG: fimbria/pilus periplasmic chaperone [Gammaproteobacteria bacterium]|nr:fimbria/pilus periplasmic chaperone [Gammaproteobacteria bacterium]MDH5777010.1 fimbria/pilus periplasmic chaperone [Gammaproteobacteria bacterium]
MLNIKLISTNNLRFVFVLTTILVAPQLYASGDLLISPTRIVFEKQTRTGSVNLVNAGKETNTYRIEFVQRRMKTDGGFEEVKKARSGEQFSNNMIRFSPRQVTLQPGQAQAIRLMLRKPPKLADGEYRSHLLFRAIPKASSTSVRNQSTDDKSIQIKLTPVMGISIPVIVRHGKTSVTTSIDKLRYYPKTSNMIFNLIRVGNASVYGDLTMKFTDKGGKSYILRQLNGLAVYTPNDHRRVNVPIKPPKDVKLEHGTMSVQFHSIKEAGGKLLAEKSIQIP